MISLGVAVLVLYCISVFIVGISIGVVIACTIATIREHVRKKK